MKGDLKNRKGRILTQKKRGKSTRDCERSEKRPSKILICLLVLAVVVVGAFLFQISYSYQNDGDKGSKFTGEKRGEANDEPKAKESSEQSQFFQRNNFF